MPGLFDKQQQNHLAQALPLAARMRPRTLQEFVGQLHFLAEGSLLQRLIRADRLGSLIFYGPPGTGKTTLAHVISQETAAQFRSLNAASCGVKEIRAELSAAADLLKNSGQKTILFVDELHHFSKTQQDVLLPELERGIVTLIGATTENPFFALNSALLSRSHLFQFEPLENEEIVSLLQQALTDPERGLGQLQLQIEPAAAEFLIEIADGDARRALNALEVAALSRDSQEAPEKLITLALVQESVQRKALNYDQEGDQHYDTASAFIKSIRGSDPDAAIYWLARMLEAGESPRFIARRLMIAASEDIGNADPQALILATSAAQAVEMIGLPEGRIILAQATTYLATAPKSNASYAAINQAQEDVRTRQLIPVPKHLRDAHYAGSQQLGHGAGYDYPHSHEAGWVEQDYLGVDKQYYLPVDRGYEQTIAEWMDQLRPTSREE